MTELGIRPNKGLGQHFLFERGIVERMVRQAGVSREDTVLEVGPGLGILTSELLRKAGGVVAVELDRSLAAHLTSTPLATCRGSTLVEGNALDTLDRRAHPAGRAVRRRGESPLLDRVRHPAATAGAAAQAAAA